jgi:hypothetical protein
LIPEPIRSDSVRMKNTRNQFSERCSVSRRKSL